VPGEHLDETVARGVVHHAAQEGAGLAEVVVLAVALGRRTQQLAVGLPAGRVRRAGRVGVRPHLRQERADVLGGLEDAESPAALGVHDAIRDAHAVEPRELLGQVVVVVNGQPVSRPAGRQDTAPSR